ncbi:Predicted dehydrogenase [Halobacillus karajensis]|uniref:Glucose--fructose oxidoreductase n=1 Tax=Halobacillus karajensis TaxID=195088 RepID=A0A024P317_9BACI|nr:Gfo/Idh/MocA family oxidoreductase [Halobacillus karajensis]CDQ18868.1 Glucose--fructose oxidoreductase precursor [Halobacillus karajensis]CDQ23059.1 Glucose--fructose oxidoreductase precursor [Halobacillus karajensis]CDQ26541.1 Glucose--fructose oxidoreductase precursor [Halobacillus karajensis]SEH45006.1 Predicted dehydrogenase [Halobacillus karajensis]
MTTLKIAVIGCGSIAQNRHLPEYKANKNIEIQAVCDIVEERARKVGHVYGAAVYTDYEELLRKEEVDAVSVCLPNYLHAPVSIAALKAGHHVLCEKPMATSKEEAEEMIQAAEQNGKKLMIAHNQRFVPSHVKAKELIASGELGKVYSFRTTFGHGGPEGWSAEGEDSWFFKKEQAFIGAMGDLGVHKADLLRYLLGEEFVDVAGFIENNAKKDITVDDNAVCILRSESGIVGTMAASWAYNPNEDNSTVIYGEKGTLRLEDDPEYSLVAQYTNGDIVNYQLGKIQSNEEGGQSNSHVIDHFVGSILNDTQPLITGEEGMKSLEIILGALRSGETREISSLEKVTK